MKYEYSDVQFFPGTEYGRRFILKILIFVIVHFEVFYDFGAEGFAFQSKIAF